MNFRQYYIELANLVYAIAMADGKIQHEEVQSLQKEVKKYLKPLSESIEGKGVEDFEATEIFFNILKDNEIDSHAALDSYLRFVDNNKGAISPKLKTATIKIIENVADAYKGIDDSEKRIIKEVKHKLEEI